MVNIILDSNFIMDNIQLLTIISFICGGAFFAVHSYYTHKRFDGVAEIHPLKGEIMNKEDNTNINGLAIALIIMFFPFIILIAQIIFSK